MQSISRRGLVLSATAAGAAFGLDGTLEIISPAHAQKADMIDKGFAKGGDTGKKGTSGVTTACWLFPAASACRNERPVPGTLAVNDEPRGAGGDPKGAGTDGRRNPSSRKREADSR